MKIGYIIGTFPLITTTFIDREIAALRERGFNITILSIRRPPPEVEQIEEYRAVTQSVIYLLPAAWVAFLLAHLRFAITRPREYWSLLIYLLTRQHPSTRLRGKTLLHFAEGVYAADLLRNTRCDHFHAHFADRAATVALCVSRLLGKPYSLTMHANDLFAGPVLLYEKILNAKFAVTVSEFNKGHILRQHPVLDATKIAVLHPWVNLKEFVPPPSRPKNARFTIVSVGRLVEKKGHRFLIEACRHLRQRGVHVDCHIVGSGPLESELRSSVAQQGLNDCVTLEGAQPKARVLELLAQADVFVLASLIGRDGDRDGMPVALAEAMAMQVPVVSTNIVGIGELVRQGAGYLVPPQDSLELAAAIESVAEMDEAARAKMGAQGRAIIEEGFGVDRGIDSLADLFYQSVSDHQKIAFFVWGAPSVGPRSQVLARELDIPSLHFVRANARRGILSAPFRYIYQAVEMWRRLRHEMPQVVFVQSPPSFAVLCAYVYSRLTGARYLVDAHSAALQQRIWMSPRWLHRLLVRNAIATLVTNEHFEAQIQADGGRAFVLRDIPTKFPVQEPSALEGQFRVAVVNTFQDDEPLEEIIAAARELPDVQFYITGKKQAAKNGILAHVPANGHFTDFLPDPAYYGLLAGADAVMCLTTREHTMQRGACEALSLGKPIITSDTELLQSYFDKGTVHVSNRCASIRDGVLRLRANLPRYQADILALQSDRQAEWQQKKAALVELVGRSSAGKHSWQI